MHFVCKRLHTLGFLLGLCIDVLEGNRLIFVDYAYMLTLHVCCISSDRQRTKCLPVDRPLGSSL